MDTKYSLFGKEQFYEVNYDSALEEFKKHFGIEEVGEHFSKFKAGYNFANKEKKGEVVKPTFTHLQAQHGIEACQTIRTVWENIQLLKGKREGLDQFIVWDNGVNGEEYFLFLGDKGNVFDELIGL